MYKMTKENGKPQIRFAKFKDTWEQRKLGDIITEYKETVDSDCTLPILTSSKTEGVILQEEHFGRKQQHDITGYNILPRNYCTYRNRSDGVDFTFNINKCCDKGIISKFYPVFSGKNSDVFFLSLVLNNSEEVVREIAYTCTGTGQKVLSFLDLQKMKVRVPNFDEQKEIAAYFESLDHIITLHQRKYDKLTKVKKSMLEKMFPKNGANVPEIRFKGFTDAWEQRKFKDTFDYMQNNALSRAELSSADGKVMNVHYGDILIKYGEVIDVKKDELTYLLDESLVKKYQTSLLQNGDIIIADAAEDETVGKCSEMAGLTDEIVLSGLHTIPCRPKENFAEGYLGYYMNSGSYHDQLLPLIQGTKISSISKSAIQNTYIMYPKAESEQEQIGAYFKQLDRLITLHQRELEKLKILKKACLEKMFV